jgi:hypothetical protein
MVDGSCRYISEFLEEYPPMQHAEPDSEDEDVPTRTMRTVCNALVKCIGEDVKDAVSVLGQNPYHTTTGEMLLASMAKCGISQPILSPKSPSTRERLSIPEQEERLVQVIFRYPSERGSFLDRLRISSPDQSYSHCVVSRDRSLR